jgi:hypothetical protein
LISTLYEPILHICLLRTTWYLQFLRTKNLNIFRNSSVFYILSWCKTPWGWSAEGRRISKYEWILQESVILILLHFLVLTIKLFINAQIWILSSGKIVLETCDRKRDGTELSVYDKNHVYASWRMTNVTNKFLSVYLFLLITLYMFRAHRVRHQERQIVSIQFLVTVTLFWWPCRVQVGSKLVW